MKHPKSIGEYTNMSKLAEDIGDLHYEQLEILLVELARKIKSDGFKDMNRGRDKLSIELLEASSQISKASSCIGKALLISKPFMDE